MQYQVLCYAVNSFTLLLELLCSDGSLTSADICGNCCMQRSVVACLNVVREKQEF